MSHIRLQRVRGLDRVIRGRLDGRSGSKTGGKYPSQSTIRPRVSWWGMRLRPCSLVRRLLLGYRAMSHIRLQRVRGLDRVLRGRPDGRSALEMRKYPHLSRLFDLV